MIDVSIHKVAKIEITPTEKFSSGSAYRVLTVTTSDGTKHEISLHAGDAEYLKVRS